MMTNLRVSNKTDNILTIMIEPVASTFDVNPDESADIRMPDSPDLINIDVHQENFVSVWATSGTEVVINGETFRL
jgi:hypothetical protein